MVVFSKAVIQLRICLIFLQDKLQRFLIAGNRKYIRQRNLIFHSHRQRSVKQRFRNVAALIRGRYDIRFLRVQITEFISRHRFFPVEQNGDVIYIAQQGILSRLLFL